MNWVVMKYRCEHRCKSRAKCKVRTPMQDGGANTNANSNGPKWQRMNIYCNSVLCAVSVVLLLLWRVLFLFLFFKSNFVSHTTDLQAPILHMSYRTKHLTSIAQMDGDRALCCADGSELLGIGPFQLANVKHRWNQLLGVGILCERPSYFAG